MLAKAERPLIIVGGGAQGASKEVRELAERLQAPVAAFRMGLGVADARHPLTVPWYVAHQLWPRSTWCWRSARACRSLSGWGTDKKLTIIRIETDNEEMGRIERPTLGLTGDARTNVAALLEVLKPIKERAANTDLGDRKAKFYAEVESVLPDQSSWVKALRTALPENGVLVEEMTQVGYACRFSFPVYNPRSYLTSGFQGTLGWGVATTIGVKAARRDRPVVSINGDGGFMFTDVGALHRRALQAADRVRRLQRRRLRQREAYPDRAVQRPHHRQRPDQPGFRQTRRQFRRPRAAGENAGGTDE